MDVLERLSGKGQRFHRCRLVLSSSAAPADKLFIGLDLALPAQGPLYLTGKVKAYSPEATPQRSTSSLGARDGGEKRRETRFCSAGCRFSYPRFESSNDIAPAPPTLMKIPLDIVRVCVCGGGVLTYL